MFYIEKYHRLKLFVAHAALVANPSENLKLTNHKQIFSSSVRRLEPNVPLPDVIIQKKCFGSESKVQLEWQLWKFMRLLGGNPAKESSKSNN